MYLQILYVYKILLFQYIFYSLENFYVHIQNRFCVGDRFYLCENKILCEYDYEERLVFASIGNHPMLKRHATNVSQTQSQQQQQPSFNKGNMAANHHQAMMSMEAQQKSHDDHNNNNSHGHPPGCGSMYNSQHMKIPHNT